MAACLMPILSCFMPGPAEDSLERADTVVIHADREPLSGSYLELPVLNSFASKMPPYSGIHIMDVLEPVEEHPDEHGAALAPARSLRVSYNKIGELARSPSKGGEGGFPDRISASPSPAPGPEARPAEPAPAAATPRGERQPAPATPGRRPSHPVLPLESLPETLYVSRLPGAHKYHSRKACGTLVHKLRRAELNLRVHHPCPKCFSDELAALPTALAVAPRAPAPVPALAVHGPEASTVQAA